ncbi:MAG: hypothetical protein KC613_07825 [Myxococcales bacterium]|nr:hypothetical protein [Myxococcales bacterium]
MDIIRFFAAAGVLFGAAGAHARADIAVDFTPPATIQVGATDTFQVAVTNQGTRRADNVEVHIGLPATMTSPQVHVRGDLGAFSPACWLSGDTTLSCDLGRLNKGASATVAFDLALPAAVGPTEFQVEARTTSRESDVNNNALSEAVTLTYVNTPIAAGTPALVRHCTGQNLTSFYECTLYPSSISSHDIVFQAGNAITFPNAPGNYTGWWSQPAPDRLSYTYYEDGAPVVAYQGYGVGGGCFEGVALFIGGPWVAGYEVCLQ